MKYLHILHRLWQEVYFRVVLKLLQRVGEYSFYHHNLYSLKECCFLEFQSNCVEKAGHDVGPNVNIGIYLINLSSSMQLTFFTMNDNGCDDLVFEVKYDKMQLRFTTDSTPRTATKVVYQHYLEYIRHKNVVLSISCYSMSVYCEQDNLFVGFSTLYYCSAQNWI